MPSRYLRLLYCFWYTTFQVEVEYKLNFIVELLSVIGNLLGSLFVLSLFYAKTDYLGGWSWNSSLVVLGIYYFLESLTISVLQPNLSRIVNHIRNGTLDFILLKPINSQFLVSTRILSPWGIPSLLVGMILIMKGTSNASYNYSLSNLLLAFITITCSLVILYSIWFMIATTSIWFVKVWNANEVLRAILVAGRYPVSAFPSGIRTIFTFIIPIGFLTTVPAQAILGDTTSQFMLYAVLMSGSFFLISTRFWNFALRYYTSASS